MKSNKIEIWSDVACPFCFIGKHHLEKALEQLPELTNELEIEWKSFILDPGLPTDATMPMFDYLQSRKGMPKEKLEQMATHLKEMGENAGIALNIKDSVVTNTTRMHQLIQLAKTQDKGTLAEERFFKAYFSENLDCSKQSTLIQLAVEIGLDESEAGLVLEKGLFLDKVEQDIYEARLIHVNSVPHFVLNDRFSLSGAQPVETFKGFLQQIHL